MATGRTFIIATIVAPPLVAIRARLFRWVVWPTEQRASFERKPITNSTAFGKPA
jgi:hypothetical protein